MVQRVTVLTRVEGLYEAVTFEEQTQIAFNLLAELSSPQPLTAAQVLNAEATI
ncbi:hypothetical protein GS597_02935 [Synechococcales cyanobacterium C]|uniref:Uncharacterized protein n=1 Tax=Petrachloros mirabilis ULC683 TaxID=2781853 RepID=A0A8K2A6U2_9CYAN|nr:hypothetical protein [Petrachloros mirabilis ULC683]